MRYLFPGNSRTRGRYDQIANGILKKAYRRLKFPPQFNFINLDLVFTLSPDRLSIA